MPDGYGRHPGVDRYGNDVGSHVGEPLEASLDVLAEEGPYRLSGVSVCVCVRERECEWECESVSIKV